MSHAPEPVILVASAEFTLKSSPVRRTLEQRLKGDLKFALSRAGFSGSRIEKDAARLVVRGLGEARLGAQSCSRVFGVAYAAPALLLSASMEAVLESIVKFADNGLRSGQSFAIRAHRSSSSPLSRRDIELKGGSQVLQALKDKGVKVDLGHPDLTIHVDLAGERAYVYGEKLQGPGGLPISSQWKMLAVLDSGPLTLLAAYAMMRRGCLAELFVPISSGFPTFASESQLDLARRLRELVTRPSYRVFTIDLEELLGKGLDQPLDLASTRRLVRMAAAKFAREKRFKGIIFADVAGGIGPAGNLGIESAEVPVFTPLIGLEREDLTEMCRLSNLPLADWQEEKLEPSGPTFEPTKRLGDAHVQQLSF